jgi:AbrB family looped-hinge helix DNA binding protein
MHFSAVISSKGQLVIPAALRRKYRLKEGTTVSFREEQGRLVMEPDNFTSLLELQGTLPDYPFEKALNEERRIARLREDRQ